MIERPFSQACENNKDPILDILRDVFAHTNYVLEIGSGTGQHAAYFSQQLAPLIWQPADLPEHIPGISSWVEWAEQENLLTPLTLDVNQAWPITATAAVYSANTLHIMSWQSVQQFFAGIKQHLTEQGLLCVYGPFNYQGAYTSDSNAQFDQWLKARNPVSAIRDFEAVDQLAKNAGLTLLADHSMPANNRLLVWQAL